MDNLTTTRVSVPEKNASYEQRVSILSDKKNAERLLNVNFKYKLNVKLLPNDNAQLERCLEMSNLILRHKIEL